MTDARRAIIYARISLDAEGTGAGVARQEEDCRDLAQRNGWAVVEAVTDNFVSAYSGKVRPGFAAVLAAVRDGRADTVLCWHLDRLARRGADLAALLDLREVRPGLAVVPVRGYGTRTQAREGAPERTEMRAGGGSSCGPEAFWRDPLLECLSQLGFLNDGDRTIPARPTRIVRAHVGGANYVIRCTITR